MHAILNVAGLELARGGRRLAVDLNFSVPAGGALVVTGPNGAGKSTLLRAIAGLLPAAKGSIALSGAGIDPDDPPGVHAHYLGHSDALKTALTARENLAFWAQMLAGRVAARSPIEALAALGLDHAADLPVGWLSAGQKRRVALARLLVAARPAWILDEPATALDIASQNRFASLMAEHRAQGGLIVAATHAPLGLVEAAELRLGAPA